MISIGSYSENSVYNDQGIRAIKSDKTSNRVLNRNDLTMILNDKTTSGNIIGRVLLIEESGIYVYNQRTERIEINLDEYDPVFLYEMLNAPNIREKIIKQAQGNTQIYVNWTTISLLEYMIPSKEEQVKIGEHLHGISNLIALHQHKCDEMKKLKKCMLQKMFPQNGKKVPEIRFEGFTNDWEQRKLGEVFEFQYGEFNNNPDNGGEYPIYGANGIIGGYTDWNAENSSIIGHMGAYAGYVVWGEGKHFVTYNGTIARPKDNSIDSKYGYYLLDSKKIYKICAGSGQPFVSYSDLNGIDILLPKDKDEQRLLAYYFTNLDHLITLHQHKCDELQNLKKYMLQNMFV